MNQGGGGNEKKKKFQFVHVRPEDLEPPSALLEDGDPQKAEAWIQQRMKTIEHCEKRIDAAFQAQRGLVFKLVETGGIKKFQKLWEALVETSTTNNNSSRIPSLLARAAQETTLFAQENGFEDMMASAYEKSADESTQTSQTPSASTSHWPILPQLFPELSEWVLTPDKILTLVERECPVLLVDSTPEAKVIDHQSWTLLLKHGRLCEDGTSKNNKESIALEEDRSILVRDTEEPPNYWKHGSTRLFVLSTFLTALVEFTKTEDTCAAASCGRTDPKLKLCSRCHCVQYCSRDCQVADFKTGGHQQDCRALLDLRERYSRNDIPADAIQTIVEAFPYPQLRDTFLGDVVDQIKEQDS